MAKAGTKETILKLGEELIRSKGFNAFSYQHIAAELGVKNAAIHYHYPSKDMLGVDVIKGSLQKFEKLVADMKAKGLNEQKQLEKFLAMYSENIEKNERICLVGSISSDFHAVPVPMQRELKTMAGRIIEWLSELLKDGKRKKLFAFNETPRVRALLILTNMAAGLQFARVTGKEDFYVLKRAVLNQLKP